MNVLEINQRPEVAGWYRLAAVNAETGEERLLADWFPNLILDAGLNRWGTGGVIDRVSVGSGSTPPVVGDTALQSLVASTTNLMQSDSGAQASAPYYGWQRLRYRFNAGTATGNLSEVGVGWNGGLFSRALIKDSNGDPTTITVLSNEYLDVTYELRLYPPLDDATFNVTISGTTYACVLRAANVTNSSYWPPVVTQQARTHNSSGLQIIAYNGDISAITGAPSGVSSTGFTPNSDAYSNNSLEATGSWQLPLDAGNLSGGIKSIMFPTNHGAYQVSFTPPLPKDNTKTLTLNAKVSWARAS